MIYLDNNATTTIAPQVRDTVISCMDEFIGNPASVSHYEGMRASLYLEECRQMVARLIDASPHHIYFNSGASEANNTVLKSVTGYFAPQGKVHIITSQIEHKCVLNTCAWLSQRGVEVTWLPVDTLGMVSSAAVAAAIRPHTRLISIMAANNESGVLQPIKEIGEIARANNILFHTDAAQWVGKLPFSVSALQADFVSFSAHKFYGPKGVGALYCTRPEIITSESLIQGGGQESGTRGGTVNLPGIAGMAKAAELFILAHDSWITQQNTMKQHFIDRLLARVPGTLINGCRHQSLPNTVNFSLPDIKASTLLKKLKMKIALSSASACHSAEQKPSHVLSAMGLNDHALQSAIRLSLSHLTRPEEMDSALELLVLTANRLRGIS